MLEPKKTPVFSEYEKHGGKIVDFAGFLMPIQFSAGITEEHKAVREAAGLFDVSHMGEVSVKGKDAVKYLDYLLTNDVSSMQDGKVLYAMMCYPNGGIVDDLIVYRFDQNDYLLVVNAGNTDKDYQWMLDHQKGFDVTIENISDTVAQLAIQGPKAQVILQRLTDYDLNIVESFTFVKDIPINNKNCLISRTGYTGEDGFEIYCDTRTVVELWNALLQAGAPDGILPVGLGARDTLRFEAALPLYGNELDKDILATETGLNFCIKLDKKDFIGQQALADDKERGSKRKLAGFELSEKGVPRHGYEITKNGETIGFVTTGYISPTLNKAVGFGLVAAEHSVLDTEINIVIRNKPVKARIVNKKFYKRSK